MYDTNVLGVIQPVSIICASWKWLDETDIHARALTDYKGYKGGVVDDTKLVKELWGVLDAADVVVAHNGDSFDIKIMNTRFVAAGLNAPSHYKTIDTLKVARKYFRFSANKLDSLGEYLGVGRKAPTGGFETWIKCMAGDKEAWETMVKYNVHDIELLEKVYLKLRPYMQNHPVLAQFDPKPVVSGKFPCGTCESTNTNRRGFMTTKAGRYQRYQCLDCGSWSSGPYEKVKP